MKCYVGAVYGILCCVVITIGMVYGILCCVVITIGMVYEICVVL